MPKKKGFNAERYQNEILSILEKEQFMSTSEICNKMSMGYETGLKYIYALQNAQKIRLKKRGNRQFWFVA